MANLSARQYNVNKDSWEEDKLVKRMCDAFWEDVCISADLEKILNFSGKSNKRNVTRECLPFEIIMYCKTFSKTDGTSEIKDKLLELKKYIEPDIWNMLLPFFIYVEPDIDLDNLNNYTLDTFKRNNFIYSLGLLTGKYCYYEKLSKKIGKCDSLSKCPKKYGCRYFSLFNYLKDVKYERHMELYDKMLEDNLNLGNNMDFLEYWIERFKEEEDSEWEDLLKDFVLY